MRTIFSITLSGLMSGAAMAQAPTPVRLPVPTPELVKSLIEVLKDADAEVRINASNALAAVGSAAVEALTASLADPNRDARAGAAYALGQMGAEGAPAGAALVKALKDNETEVRRQAAQALGRILLAQRLPTAPAAPTLAPPQPLPPPVFPPEKPSP
jgi:HEAT repeat protein